MAGQGTDTPRDDYGRKRRDQAALAAIVAGTAAVLAAAWAWHPLAGLAVTGILLAAAGVATGMG